uniref:Chloride channel protein 2-like n=1 Tax=Saccoglossus kowalevskii TaxID=10224 RepID=A0ABM0LWV4_SACKO|nr:PREDICTED: chloride channel protein 2-like [Saccoglossus kowalevskii]
MHGQYRTDLARYAKDESVRIKLEQEKLRRLEKEHRRKEAELRVHEGSELLMDKCKAGINWIRRGAHSSVGDDWVFLTLLGVVMALLSFAIDYCVALFQKGSGIPQLKTIIRGIILKEYLSFRTAVSKIVGLGCALGTSLPLGKVGPFVHIANMVATVLNRWISKVTGAYVNEYKNYDMLVAACAVGVACTFSAPIGGVLFSIEVTTSYFAVRNYFRGFFSATCAALMFRLLAVWSENEETIVALYNTSFRLDIPYDVTEIFVFALIGVFTGFGGALFVYMHRKTVEFNRRPTIVKRFLQKNRFIYPAIVTIILSTLTFPLGFGQFMAGEFWMTVVAITMPIACGVFMPIFIVGAAFGRLIGESMAAWFPEGIWQGGRVYPIIPGGYAVVGAAALSGGVTHTVSTAVIVAELSGQITHILPVMVAVLIANAIALLLQPSIYDSLIQINKLPYLPDIPTGEARTHHIFAEDIMTRDLDYVAYDVTYMDLRVILANTYHRTYPLVANQESMTLYGIVDRSELEYMLDKHTGRQARLEEASRRALGSDELNQNVPSNGDKKNDFTQVNVEFDPDIGKPQNQAPSTTRSKTDTLSPLMPKKLEFSIGESQSSLASDLRDMVVDMNPREQLQWESDRVQEVVNFDNCHIDPAPLQIVEKSSLHKIHTLFNLLSVNKAYVTSMGRLVGIVSLDEVRTAIVGSGIYDGSDSEDDDTFYDSYEDSDEGVEMVESINCDRDLDTSKQS